MYSINNIQFKQLSPILDLEVPIRKIYSAAVALVADHSNRNEALNKSYGKEEMDKHATISNQQGDLGQIPTEDAHDLEKAFYNAKSVYFGLAIKDVFLSAAIKGAVTPEELTDYVDKEIRTEATVKLLNDIGMPALAKIVECACVPA